MNAKLLPQMPRVLGAPALLGLCLSAVSLPSSSAAVILETNSGEYGASVGMDTLTNSLGYFSVDLPDEWSFPVNAQAPLTSGSGIGRASAAGSAALDADGNLQALTFEIDVSGSGASAEPPDPWGIYADAYLSVRFEVTEGPVEAYLTAETRLDVAPATAMPDFDGQAVFSLKGFPFDRTLFATGENPFHSISETVTLGEGRTYSLEVAADFHLDPRPPLIASGRATVRVTITFGAGPETNEFRWINEAGGSFSTASNWDREEVPGEDATAIVDVPGSYTIDVGAQEIERFLVGGEPSLNVTLANANLTAQSTSPSDPGVVIDHGHFTLDGGELHSAHGLVGSGSATQATIAGGLWDNQAQLTIGGGGEATLLLEEGGRVRSPALIVGGASNGAFGAVTNHGGTLETADLAIGDTSAGTLSIQAGGAVTADPILFHSLDPNDPLNFAFVGRGAPGKLVVHGTDPATREPSSFSFVGATMFIGSGGAQGEMVIDGGGLVEITPGLIIGQSEGSVGAVTVTGGDETTFEASTLSVNDLGNNLIDGVLRLGAWGGRGVLTLDGGKIDSTNAEIGGNGDDPGDLPGVGIATIDGGGTWEIEEKLAIDGLEDTSLTVESGWLRVGDLAAAATFDPLSIGSGGGAHGTLRLARFGASATVAKQIVRIGKNGTGQLIIEGGAEFLNAFGMVAGDLPSSFETNSIPDDGRIIVRGFGSDGGGGPNVPSFLKTETVTGIAQIALYNNALLSVEAGARVEGTVLVAGGQETSPGRIVVDGTGGGANSTLIADELSVGSANFGGNGSFVVSDAGIASLQSLEVSGLGVADFRTGSIILGAGHAGARGVLFINSGGELKGDGLLIGNLAEGGGVNNFAGTVTAGTSPGALTIDGNYTQGAAGVLEIELSGLEPGFDHDQLIVTGAATFDPGTTIRLVLADPNPGDESDEIFVPRTGDSFNFLVADALTLPPGQTLSGLVTFSNLPAGVSVDFQTSVLNGRTIITGHATSTLPPGGLRIIAHPHPAVAAAGTAAHFAVKADGAPGLTYQWLRDGDPIAGATNSSFSVFPVAPSDASAYSVAVSAGADSVVSRNAKLRITPPPRLSVARSVENIQLSWPVLPAGFILQSISDLASDTEWRDFTPPPIATNGQNVLTVPLEESAQLFRLQSQP